MLDGTESHVEGLPIGAIFPVTSADGVMTGEYLLRTDKGTERFQGGEAVRKEDYPALWSVIQDQFGDAPDGEFKLPDLGSLKGQPPQGITYLDPDA
jgi:hypothetical protein